jgi:Holliday junction resolvase RusA-like endonuclease
VIALTLPYPPSANIYWRTNRSGNTYVSGEAKRYKETVGWKALEAQVTPIKEAVIIRLDVYRPRKVGDLDNRIKVLVDSLQGFVYENDEQIVEIHARRFDDKKNPRVEVKITRKRNRRKAV